MYIIPLIIGEAVIARKLVMELRCKLPALDIRKSAKIIHQGAKPDGR